MNRSLRHDVVAYLSHLADERLLSEHTVAAYRHDLTGLLNSLAAQQVVTAGQTMAQHIEQWLVQLGKRGLQAASRRRAHTAARQFFHYLVVEQRLAANPAADVVGPRPERAPPRVLSEQQAAAVVEAPPLDSLKGQRDRAMLELLYGSGLRASELCWLRLDDVGLQTGLVRPCGKGDRERLVPLSTTACAVLDTYLNHARPLLLNHANVANGSPYVFFGRRGRPLSRMGLYKIVQRWAHIGCPEQAVSPHALRHACATHMLRGGSDLRAVQTVLGHANISTTEIYTHLAQETLRAAVENHHPLGGAGSRQRGQRRMT